MADFLNHNESERPASKTVAFYTLGCRTNQLESSAIADEFRNSGWSVLPFREKASLYVINSCTVTADSDRESRRIIRKAKRINPDARIAVIGCYAQVSSAEAAAIEGVDYVIGNNFKTDIVKIVENPPHPNPLPQWGRGSKCSPHTTLSPIGGEGFRKFPLVYTSVIDKGRILPGATESALNRTRASLKIQDGCDFRCSYCIIWKARGPSRSLPATLLKSQLEELTERGYREIVLTGINISQYRDPETNVGLAELLSELARIPGDFRIRLSSLDPKEVDDNLLSVMAENPKVCPHLHLSIQSADDYILKRMARRHRLKELLEISELIEQKLPYASIGADIIAGFPGETPEHFESSYHALSKLPLSYFHTFPYSKRNGTAASDFPDQVDEREKSERTGRLIALSREKNLEYRKSFLGKELQVIVEGKRNEGLSENFIRIKFERFDVSVGDAPRGVPLFMDENGQARGPAPTKHNVNSKNIYAGPNNLSPNSRVTVKIREVSGKETLGQVVDR